MLVAIPALSALVCLVQRDRQSLFNVSQGYSIIGLVQTLLMMFQFDTSLASGYQFEVMGVLGIDGISLWQIFLTNQLMPIVIQSFYKSLSGDYGQGYLYAQKQYQVQLKLIGFWAIAVFSVKNLLLFYISFEGAQVPMYFLISLYGTSNKKIHASYLFFIYTVIGSQFLFLALQGLYIENGTGDYQVLQMSRTDQAKGWTELIQWFAFFICFAIKLPIVGVHIWLQQAHVQAPTEASVLLAAILLKLGSYGLIRYSIPLFPYASQYFRPQVIVLCQISIQYAAIAAQSQTDFKRIVAYSSVSHMGTATQGLFTNDYLGIEASIYFLISHGLIAGAQFLLVGVIYTRYHTRTIIYYRGLVHVYPQYIQQLQIFSLANSGVPMTSGFIGEILSLQGAIHQNPFVATIASLSIILVPSFMQTQLHRQAYGRMTTYLPVITSDITRKEAAIFIPLVVLVIYLGVNPSIMFEDIQQASILLLQSLVNSLNTKA